MKTTGKLLLIFFIVINCCLSAFSQDSRTYIKQSIAQHGSCKTVAITQNYGDVCLYGKNGWACKNCPVDLRDALKQLSDRGKTINDVQLTENGKWLIIFDGNGFKHSSGFPAGLASKLQEFNLNREHIISASFNDEGEWVAVTPEHLSASSPDLTSWLQGGINSYGRILCVAMSDGAVVAVYDGGYKFLGSVSQTLKNALRQTQIRVENVKFSGEHWFFANKDGKYQFYM